MARKPRIHYPGACYHVILRGNAGSDIFFKPADRSRFFLLLQQGIEKYHHRIHAFCLMTNHVHLAVQVEDIPLSRIMQNVAFRYTRYINSRQKRTGYLFQGRYKALLIDADSYLLELVRYIHNNPVRAGMTKRPARYNWSSHNAYLGMNSVPWLTTDWVLSQFSQRQNRAIELYRDFVLAGKDEGYRKEFHQGKAEGRILGDDRFGDEALARASQKMSRKTTSEDILQAVCNCYHIRMEDLSGGTRQRRVAEPRGVAALLIRETDHLSLTDLARKLGRDLSGLSQAASRLEGKLKTDRQLTTKVDDIRQSIE